MIKKILNGQINSITAAAILIAASSLASRFLGVFRDRILAGEFGAGDTLDIYYAAFRIPDFIFNLLILGALSTGFIPVFTALLKSHPPLLTKERAGGEVGGGNKEAWKLTSSVLNILGLALIILCGAGIIFAPAIMKLITPGFDAEKMRLTVGLARVMFLSPLFLGISSVFGGALQSFKKFFVYSLTPIVYNVGIIIGALYLVPVWGVYGLAWGVVAGAFLHMIIQIPSVFNLGFKYNFIFNWKEKGVRLIGRMMVPRTLSLAVSQINLVVITIIASTLASGSLSVFNFANNLQSFPVGIFGISFAIAAFPSLSVIAFERDKLIKNFSSAVRQILFFIVPSMVLLLTLRAQIVRVVLGTGQFDWEDTVLTLSTLGFFSISLFAQALVPLLVRVFYARHDSRRPFYVGLVTAAVNVALALWLSGKLGVAGLALAFSAANIINFVILWLLLRFEIGEMDEMKILISAAKFSIAAVLAGGAVQVMKSAAVLFVDMTKVWGVFAQGASAASAGIIVYLAVCYLLRSEELFSFLSGLKRRLPWRKVEVGDQGEARGI